MTKFKQFQVVWLPNGDWGWIIAGMGEKAIVQNLAQRPLRKPYKIVTDRLRAITCTSANYGATVLKPLLLSENPKLARWP